MEKKLNNNQVKSEQPIQRTATDQPIEHYCIFYNDLFAIINGITQMSHVKFLNYICLHLRVADKGIVYLTQEFRIKAADEIRCTDRTITRAVTNLVEHHILISLPDSNRSIKYIINPLYIWKGDQNDRVATMKSLGLEKPSITKPKASKKASRAKKLKVKIDFNSPVRERQAVVKKIIKQLQSKHNYPDYPCKKFYEHFTRKTNKTEEGKAIMAFEEDELRNNRPFEWAYRLKSWHERERPDKLRKDQKKEKESDRKLKPWEKPGFNTDLLFSKDLTELEDEGY